MSDNNLRGMFARDGEAIPPNRCAFCDLAANKDAAPDSGPYVALWPDAIAITPLNPVHPKHVLVLPRAHVQDFMADPLITASTMARAAEAARILRLWPANLITSAGRAATQSVAHFHVHVVPRSEGDGLALPWTGQGGDRD